MGGPEAGSDLAVARSVVAALPDAAVLLDAELNIFSYNGRYLELSGLKRRTLDARIAGGTGAAFDELFVLVDLRDRDTARVCMTGRRPIHLADVTVRNAAGVVMTA